MRAAPVSGRSLTNVTRSPGSNLTRTPKISRRVTTYVNRGNAAALPPFHSDTSAGLVPNIITGRIANRLDLMGPNYLIDAACASSLVS